MTNQNVVVSGARSGINVGKTVAVSSTSLYPGATQKPPAVPGTYISFPKNSKILLQNLEISGNNKINSWVESMRACSPTHVKAPPLSDNHTDQHHLRPSALDMFDQITNASKGKQIVMFLDYDGTLSPIVDDPDQAFMSEAMRATVRKLARYFPSAIISGRCRDKVYNFVRLAELYYAGSHGMDIQGPSKGSKYNKEAEGVLFQPASEYLPMIDQVYNALLEVVKSVPGAKVENNKFCVSVHFRRVDDKRWIELAKKVGLLLEEYPSLRVTQGRKVLEIRPTIKWDKGKALEFLLESLGYSNNDDVFPIYLGDDRTDEDAFKVLSQRGQGIGILVSKTPKDTYASYSLQEPSEVMAFLRRLVEWRRASQLRIRKRVQESKVSL